jgi:hypothetical protein
MCVLVATLFTPGLICTHFGHCDNLKNIIFEHAAKYIYTFCSLTEPTTPWTGFPSVLELFQTIAIVSKVFAIFTLIDAVLRSNIN